MLLISLIITLVFLIIINDSTSYIINKLYNKNFQLQYYNKIINNYKTIQLNAVTISNTESKSNLFDGSFNTNINNNNLLIKDFESSSLSLRFIQQSSGKVPRSHLPSILYINFSQTITTTDYYDLLESALQWYLDSGGRISRLELAVPQSFSDSVRILCSNTIKSSNSDSNNFRNDIIPDGYVVWSTSAKPVIEHCLRRLANNEGNQFILNDVLGRLYHDIGDLKESIDYYTKALTIDPSSTATFRNLGSAYQASGNTQLAFASYQQALQLDPKDALVYLKLAYFYEDFASKDWLEAADNAISCYQYYLDNVDAEDTAVLTRFGNLLVREHKSSDAIQIYDKILSIDSTLSNVWFNKAHAEMKINDYVNAKISLEKTLQLDPSISAASHMLKALSDDLAIKVESSDEVYIKDLFNSYASIYDEHGKKLLVSTPRVIRQELAKIYKVKLGIIDNANDDVLLSPPSKKITLTPLSTCDHSVEHEIEDHSNCSGQISFMDRKLDILDLGCGTGLAGAWLKDYAKSLVGVDISDQMISIAKKKMLYEDLYTTSITSYLNDCQESYDLIVAADVISYIGDLNQIISMIPKVLRPGGHFVFTAETVDNDEINNIPERGYRLLVNGRFGYSKSYLDNIIDSHLNSNDYSIVLSRDFSPRLDAGNPVPGFLYIVERKL